VCRRSIVTARLILDHTLSYREHLTKTAVKLKNQNANTLRSFALALCYSTAEYCAQSGHALLTQVRSMCSWTLPCASSLTNFVLHLSHGFQCSPTLNRQPYEERLPLTSWWKKLSNTTVSQSSLLSSTHHCYDRHPGSRCSWTCNQLTSKVDGGVTGSRLRW